MIEITKTTYTVSNESISHYCEDLGIEIELYNITGTITHEVGCGYEVNIDPDEVSISITNEDGEDITEKVNDPYGLKQDLIESLVIEYGNLEFDCDICGTIGNYLERS